MTPRQQPRFVFEPLSENHDRAAFSCGVAALDSYLHKQARQDIKKRVAAVFVATLDGKTIAGFFTLSQFAVRLDDVPTEIAKKLPKYPMVPATLLGRLARSTDFKGQGVGELLLFDALRRSFELGQKVASTGVIVDAKDEQAQSFYRKYGFLDLPGVECRLFLPMGTIEQLHLMP